MDNTNQEIKAKFPWAWITILVILVVAFGIWIFISDRDKSTGLDGTENADSDALQKDSQQYKWSEMDQGPYKDRVSYALGTSLTDWTDSKEILIEHASVPDVILKDGTLYIYFVDVTEDGKAEQIGLIKSNDNGKTWEDKQIINIKGVGDKIPVDPAPYLMIDGRIRLYYFDIGSTRAGGSDNTANNKIYSALSDDGINFVQEQGVRFAKADIFDPDVIFDGKTWRMYVGSGDKVLSATSDDGLTFTYEGEAFEGGAIPNVIIEDGLYYLFTGGIEISTSKDGKTFTKTPDKFDSGGLTADPGVVKLAENSYFMVYKTDDGSPKAKK